MRSAEYAARRPAGRAPGLSRLQRRHGRAARLGRRHARGHRHRVALGDARVHRGGRAGAGDVRRACLARPHERRALRAQRAPGADRAGLLPHRRAARRTGLVVSRVRGARPRGVRGVRGLLRRGAHAHGRPPGAGRRARAGARRGGRDGGAAHRSPRARRRCPRRRASWPPRRSPATSGSRRRSAPSRARPAITPCSSRPSASRGVASTAACWSCSGRSGS